MLYLVYKYKVPQEDSCEQSVFEFGNKNESTFASNKVQIVRNNTKKKSYI